MAATILSRTYNTLLTFTLDADRKRLADNIHKSISVLWALEGKGQAGRAMRFEDGGALIRVPVVWRKNATAGSYRGFDNIDVTPQDEVTAVFEEWGESAAGIAIDRRSLRQNSGGHRLMSLMEEKVRIAEDSLRENIDFQLVQGTINANRFIQGNGGKDMICLPMIAGHLGTVGGSNAATTPGLSLHGINPEVEVWWKNKYKAGPGSSVGYFPVLAADMQTLYNDATKGGRNDPPNLIIGDMGSHQVYERSLFAQQRYGPYGADGEVSQAFRVLKYRTADFIWDEQVPDTYTPAVDPFTNNLGSMFFLNTNWISFVIDKESHFVASPFREPHNQTAIYSKLILMAQLTVENRRKQGLYNRVRIDATS